MPNKGEKNVECLRKTKTKEPAVQAGCARVRTEGETPIGNVEQNNVGKFGGVLV